jgi:hypothetical protein
VHNRIFRIIKFHSNTAAETVKKHKFFLQITLASSFVSNPSTLREFNLLFLRLSFFGFQLIVKTKNFTCKKIDRTRSNLKGQQPESCCDVKLVEFLVIIFWWNIASKIFFDIITMNINKEIEWSKTTKEDMRGSFHRKIDFWVR